MLPAGFGIIATSLSGFFAAEITRLSPMVVAILYQRLDEIFQINLSESFVYNSQYLQKSTVKDCSQAVPVEKSEMISF